VGVRAQILREYFGELEEESIRDNFVLIYELLDEVMVSELLRLACWHMPCAIDVRFGPRRPSRVCPTCRILATPKSRR